MNCNKFEIITILNIKLSKYRIYRIFQKMLNNITTNTLACMQNRNTRTEDCQLTRLPASGTLPEDGDAII